MRVVLSGASGFVGSNIAKVLADVHGDEVVDDRIDMFDADAVLDHVTSSGADGVIHCAIVNDWDRMLADRHFAWNGYVESTRSYADAARAAGVPFVLVSTDWVFDGTQGPADEATPPNPINIYGFLKAASELVTLDRNGAVARVSGVNGTHWARPQTPREQDAGFGYFVASLVDALEDDRPFTVWESDDINITASPSLGSMCGEVMRAIVDQRQSGVFHCCGSEAMTRRELAELTVEVFELDRNLLSFAPPPEVPPMPIPANTALDATDTARRLGTPLPDVEQLLRYFRNERSTGTVAPLAD